MGESAKLQYSSTSSFVTKNMWVRKFVAPVCVGIRGLGVKFLRIVAALVMAYKTLVKTHGVTPSIFAMEQWSSGARNPSEKT